MTISEPSSKKKIKKLIWKPQPCLMHAKQIKAGEIRPCPACGYWVNCEVGKGLKVTCLV